jgi:hypothetical protein
MALIRCPECNKKISDKAEVCIDCGYPLVRGKPEIAHKKRVQTIEQTSKEFKLAMLLGGLLSIGSCIGMFAAENKGTPFILFIIGIIIYMSGKFLAWWNNA